jgi:hypothetical protein
MRRNTFNLDDYPLLGTGEINLKPSSLFRVEGVPFYYDDKEQVEGNALLMFTGLVSRDEETGFEYIQCIPLYFYGENHERFTSALKDREFWVEISPSPNLVSQFPEGYLN